MVRQRDDNEATVGVYWRVFQFVGPERRRVWKKSFSLTRVPPTVVKKMPESSRSRYSEVLRIAKKIRDLRADLVRKKQRIFGTLQSVHQHDEPRMADAEREIDEFVI
jgi:hypothetical protein